MLRLYRLPLVFALAVVIFEAGRIPYGHFKNRSGAADAKTVALADGVVPDRDGVAPENEVQPVEAAPNNDDPQGQSDSQGKTPEANPTDGQPTQQADSPVPADTALTPDVDPQTEYDPAQAKRTWQQLTTALAKVKDSMASSLSSAAEQAQIAAARIGDDIQRRDKPPTDEGPEIASPGEDLPAGLVIRNPKESAATIYYLVDGDVHSLKPGDSEQITSPGTHVVMFDRGGNFGTAKLELTEGVYTFAVTPEGWSLTEVTLPADR